MISVYIYIYIYIYIYRGWKNKRDPPIKIRSIGYEITSL